MTFKCHLLKNYTAHKTACNKQNNIKEVLLHINVVHFCTNKNALLHRRHQLSRLSLTSTPVQKKSGHMQLIPPWNVVWAVGVLRCILTSLLSAVISLVLHSAPYRKGGGTGWCVLNSNWGPSASWVEWGDTILGSDLDQLVKLEVLPNQHVHEDATQELFKTYQSNRLHPLLINTHTHTQRECGKQKPHSNHTKSSCSHNPRSENNSMWSWFLDLALVLAHFHLFEDWQQPHGCCFW